MFSAESSKLLPLANPDSRPNGESWIALALLQAPRLQALGTSLNRCRVYYLFKAVHGLS